MKILIIGAGLTGCTIGRLLQDNGHQIHIIEKNNHVGGLCITKLHDCGIKYEPFGARTFHTRSERVKNFITQFDDFNGYTHRKGMLLNGEFFPFPITRQAVASLPDSTQIFQELEARTGKIDTTNFETATISIFGPTLYRYFIENYSKKMWGMEPRRLSAEWAPKRLELRDNVDDRCFKDEWQGLPVHGYSYLLEKMAEGLDISFEETKFDPYEYDLVISSAPIDKTFDECFGKLQYRSMAFEYRLDESWERENCGTMNLPQHERYIRKCNFKILHKMETPRSLIQYQIPKAVDEHNPPMYPVNTSSNNERFERYLRKAVTTNILPGGRLGFCKYLDMDKAVNLAFKTATLAENYLPLSETERFNEIKSMLASSL